MKILIAGFEEGESGPAGGGNALGIAFAAGRTGGGGPAAVGLLLGGEIFSAGLDAGADAGLVAVFGKGEKGEGGVERLGGRIQVRAPAAVGGLGADKKIEAGLIVRELQQRRCR